MLNFKKCKPLDPLWDFFYLNPRSKLLDKVTRISSKTKKENKQLRRLHQTYFSLDYFVMWLHRADVDSGFFDVCYH